MRADVLGRSSHAGTMKSRGLPKSGAAGGDAGAAEKSLTTRARAVALRYLAHRSRTEAELQRRLRREFDEPIVHAVVGELTESGLIDDAAFAGAWVEARNSRKPRSASAVRMELLSKGVGREVAEEAVSGLDDEGSAYRAARLAGRRYASLPEEAFKRRMWGFLRRRGYGTSVTRRAIERLSREASGDDAQS